MTPDCVHCRRQVCADNRTCQGELKALCERVTARFDEEQRARLAELADIARLRDGAAA